MVFHSKFIGFGPMIWVSGAMKSVLDCSNVGTVTIKDGYGFHVGGHCGLSLIGGKSR